VSGEGDTLMIPDGEGEIFENDTGSKFNAEVFDGKHGGGVVESSRKWNKKGEFGSNAGASW